jgi:membrane protease YdiL (CAAX protease family)
MKAWISRYPVLTLVVLTLGVQFGIVIVAGSMIPEGQRLHDVPDAHMLFRFRVFWPLIFAVLLTWYMEGMPGMRKLFGAYAVWRVPGRWYAFSLTWKFLFCYVAWAIADLAGWLPWPGAALEMFSEDHPHILTLLRSMPFILGIALVEETTWMKYCATRLQEKYSAFASCFITGIVWGLWYLPMLLLHEGVPDGVPWYMFLLSMAALAVLLGWVYNMTHSGLILYIMQVVSNIAFFVMPALPVVHDGDPSYVIGFIWVEVAVATFVVLRYGMRDMGLGPRPTWSDPKIPSQHTVSPKEPSPNAIHSAGMIPETVRTP